MPTAPAMDTSFDPAGTEPSTQPRPYSRPADVVATELGTDVSCGLSRQVAADRLAANGPNELPSKPPAPAHSALGSPTPGCQHAYRCVARYTSHRTSQRN